MKGDRMNDLINKQIEIPNSILEENLSEEQIIENYEELYNANQDEAKRRYNYYKELSEKN